MVNGANGVDNGNKYIPMPEAKSSNLPVYDNSPLSSEEISLLRKNFGDVDGSGVDDVDVDMFKGKPDADLVSDLGGPAKVRLALDIMSGKVNLTAEQLSSSLALPKLFSELGIDQKHVLPFVKELFFGGADDTRQMTLRYSGNPILAPLLKLASLAYSSGIQLEKSAVTMVDRKHALAIESAEETFAGAMKSFICNMVAGGLTLGFGGISMVKYIPNRNNPEYKSTQWFGPVGAQLFGQTIQQGGEYAQQLGSRDAAKTDADKQEVDDLLQMLRNLIESTRSSIPH